MSKRKIIIMLLLLMVVSNIFVLKYANLKVSDITLSYNVMSDNSDTFQVFFSDGSEWSEDNSQKIEYKEIGEDQKLEFSLPLDTNKVRLDVGNKISNIRLSKICISYILISEDLNISKDIINVKNINQIDNIKYEDEKLYISSKGIDPYIIYNFEDNEIANMILAKKIINIAIKAVLCIILDTLFYIIIKRSNSVFILVQDLYNSKTLIWSLAKNDFKTKYAGSYLGIVWAFIQPIVTIILYWFVFEFGLKATSPSTGIPFIIWFASGLIPWFFFSDAILNATNCLFEYSYLVKKVVFKISILPIVKIISSLFVHFAFIIFMLILTSLYGFFPTYYLSQLIYYIFCTFFLVLAISYTTSAVVLFFRDLGQIINILLQIGMWATPIMWSYSIVPMKYQWIIKINPMYYIIEGYRDTFFNNIWFFEKYFQTIYFWIISLCIFGLGALMFKKLKPHFADVL